ncbi:MAG: prolipoprotein diacylglyceryl transferase [Sphingomonadaceae bacterium]|uniref:Phosphatidylglycerol--prolipoprotein diacylglyceryl transferase n=1 Tax=Qipengyuania citrea LAMA 915 TaxID=1306953 RepID=A0A0L1KAI9_9SPHN|nr:prolipoprotein diacylglyceryl transferase [Qipengyuania citrea]MAL53617.1 prolipoprotein diacylglyceryl transferase [Sphingomonadaceae bacterium]MCZ4263942.1 prolipoprotein diacylglyceryl transferase [Erythrobacter sp. G21629-S1]HBM04853.1 prolipoprotein diacylglyceryl transferase [Erythrobacter sp.]KNH00904.1 Prolipoprotein diacylglyceryl transferase [Qipengyuania citrea LAMA 915]MCD1589187.1 prolipoprotein diacylglyceryl transferase [Qipengyuania citrea]
MLSLLAASGAAEPIYWENLGLRPYLFEVGGFQLRFYSLAYLLGILFAYWHLSKMIKAPGAPMAQRHADDLFFYCTLGVILGGRIGYAAFYKPELFASADVFKLWEGGMSFHGGVIGVLVAISWVAWRGGLNWLRICDYIAVNVPLAYMLGRLANFVNGELYGRAVASDFPLAMVFPTDPDQLPRHPSQLYQAGFEGLLLGLLLLALFWQTRARYRPGLLVAVFTIGMGLGRFLMEFFREPDTHLAYVVVETGLSRGQWLSLPMILIGVVVLVYALLRPATGSAGAGKTRPA